MLCVCCHPICSGRQTYGRTSRGHTGGRSHRISPPSFCDVCLTFYREKDSAVPFSSTVKSNFVYPRINRSPLVGHDPSSCDCTEIRAHVPTSEGFEVTNYLCARFSLSMEMSRLTRDGTEEHEKLGYLPNSNMPCKLGSLFLRGCVR